MYLSIVRYKGEVLVRGDRRSLHDGLCTVSICIACHVHVTTNILANTWVAEEVRWYPDPLPKGQPPLVRCCGGHCGSVEAVQLLAIPQPQGRAAVLLAHSAQYVHLRAQVLTKGRAALTD